jgi:hypothetical protein
VQSHDALSQCFSELISETKLGLEESATADHDKMRSLFWSQRRRPCGMLHGVLNIENKVFNDAEEKYGLRQTLHCRH